MARKVELTVYHEAKKLSKTWGVGPFIFSSNEARPQLLSYIITLERQEVAVLVRSDHEFSRGCPDMKLFILKHSEQAASSFHLR